MDRPIRGNYKKVLVKLVENQLEQKMNDAFDELVKINR